MGYEYKLDFELVNREQADLVLRGIVGFVAHDRDFELYSFRRVATGVMPDAHAKIDPSGVYVCINGGSHEILRDIQIAFAAVGLCAEPREL
jgi:hypothetical protein